MRIDKKFVKLGTGADEIAAADISADIPSPTGYTADSADIKGHLTGMDASLVSKVTLTETADFSNKTITDSLTIQEIVTPSTPATGDQKLYPKADGKWYQLDDGGIETIIGTNTDNEIAIAHWHPTSTDWKVLHNEFTGDYDSAIEGVPGAGDLMGFGYHGDNAQATTATAGRLGVFQFAPTSIAINTISGVSTDAASTFLSGSMEVRYGFGMKLDVVPDGTDDVSYLMGLSDDENTNATKYVQIGINRADNSTNYVCRVHDGTTETITDTGVAFDTAWHSFEIHTNAAWTDIKFYIDGVLEHTQTTNIPNNDSLQYDMTSKNVIAVTTINDWFVDWCYIAWKTTTERDTVVYLD